MPETSSRTQLHDISGQMEKVRLLLMGGGKARLVTIERHLGLSRMQTLTVLSRLEQQREICCEKGFWQLK